MKRLNSPTSFLKSLTSRPQSPLRISNPVNTSTTPARTTTTNMATAEEKNKPAVVCVFCGAVSGNSEEYTSAAKALARAFHQENITLVYGGGKAGLMGTVARELVKLSGPKSVHGVIPNALVKKVEEEDRGIPGGDVSADDVGGKAPEREMVTSGTGKNDSELLEESEYGMTTIVPDMHTRKRIMATKVIEGGPGSGFVALGGGFGTIEEVMEMVTWNQLGIHHRGIVLLNINGYWDGLLAWVKNSVEQGFVSPANAGILVERKEVGEVLEALREYQPSKGRFVLDWGTK